MYVRSLVLSLLLSTTLLLPVTGLLVLELVSRVYCVQESSKTGPLLLPARQPLLLCVVCCCCCCCSCCCCAATVCTCMTEPAERADLITAQRTHTPSQHALPAALKQMRPTTHLQTPQQTKQPLNTFTSDSYYTTPLMPG